MPVELHTCVEYIINSRLFLFGVYEKLSIKEKCVQSICCFNTFHQAVWIDFYLMLLASSNTQYGHLVIVMSYVMKQLFT